MTLNAIPLVGVDRIRFGMKRSEVRLVWGDAVEFRKTPQSETMTDDFGFDAIFMTSGADATIDLALKTVRSGGKILIFASTPKNFGYANNEIYYRELTVTSSYSSSSADLEDAFNFLQNNRVKVHGLTTVYPLEKLNEAITDTLSNKIMKAYIKL